MDLGFFIASSLSSRCASRGWWERLEKKDGPWHDVLMQKSTTEPMDPSKQFCLNQTCRARGQIGAGNIRIHSSHPQRSRCWTCKKTFSARRGTMMEGLRTAEETVNSFILLMVLQIGETKVLQRIELK